MAYLVNKDGYFKIALNEIQKNDLNFNSTAVTHTISDADFNQIRKNKSYVTIVDGVVEVNVFETTEFFRENEEELKHDHQNLKKILKDFLDNNPSSKELYSQAQTYYDTLNNLDYSTITFPLNKTWEDYCEENSIQYLHYLQIP
tara:strand:+ start:720 stop:1151 length:432 start_codon:yes stop_codon:yes gene_type:complete